MTPRVSKLPGLAAAMAFVAVAGVLWLTPSARGFDPANPNVALSDIEETVSKKYPVPEITKDKLAAAFANPNVVIFDVREPAEFAQSHIPGARRIDPGTSADEFLARYGSELKGKTVVFYCAVGVRSGIMLSRVQQSLPALGANAAYNLRGGIFRWFASGGEVIADSGTAGTIHPYDSSWNKLLQRTIKPPPDAARP